MTDSPRILVIGGTRGTGLLIAQLLERQGFPVRVLARDPVRAAQQLGASVQIVPGDLTKPDTIPPAVDAATHIVFTAGRRSGRPVREAQVKATEYQGVLNTLAAARSTGFDGRFLYMTSSATKHSFMTFALNLYKGNTLVWRGRAEEAIRASGLNYTVIRCGMLWNRPGGQREIVVTQESLPLSLRYRIARADVAEAFVAALDHPCAYRTTFEIVWGRGTRREAWASLLQRVQPNEQRR